MHDGVRDFHAGRETIDDHTPSEGFELRAERDVGDDFLVGAMQGGGEVALERLEDLAELSEVVAPDDERARTEEFGLQLTIGEEGLGTNSEQGRQRTARLTTTLTMREGLNTTTGLARGEHGNIRLLDRRREHDAFWGVAEMRGELADKGFGDRGLDHQEQARLRAELADAQGAGSRQARGDGFTTCHEGTFEQDHRIEAAHLGVDWDGDLAFGGDIHEGATARAGTSETDGA